LFIESCFGNTKQFIEKSVDLRFQRAVSCGLVWYWRVVENAGAEDMAQGNDLQAVCNKVALENEFSKVLIIRSLILERTPGSCFDV
jgi:hypothetical protein